MICRGSFFWGVGAVLLQAGTVNVSRVGSVWRWVRWRAEQSGPPRSWARPGFGVSRVVEAGVLQRRGRLEHLGGSQ